MATKPEKPTLQGLQSQYEAQFASHLADNREEQATLRARLAQLAADETWLVKALEAVSAPGQTEVGAQGPDGEPEPPQDETAPQAAKKTTARKTVAKKKATAKKPAAERAPAATKATAKKAAAKKAPAVKKQAPTAKKTAARTGEPPLGELLLGILVKHAEQPRTANEVVSDLEQRYPERARDINTVRNTLERLVAKSRIERTKQKNTVLYTAIPDSASASATGSEGTKTAETQA